MKNERLILHVSAPYSGEVFTCDSMETAIEKIKEFGNDLTKYTFVWKHHYEDLDLE